MSKIAIVFPGQGSQSVGMGKAIYDGVPSVRPLFEEAADILGFDFKELLFSGPTDVLDLTSNTQPALLVASYAAYQALKEKIDIEPSFFAGHSLGEYTALVASGVLGFADAVALVNKRGLFMQEAVPEGTGLMSAVIGLGIEALDEICKEASNDGEVVVPANINGLAQVVLSGDKAAVQRAGLAATESGAKKVIELKVSVPSHCPLMEGAAKRLAQEIETLDFGAFSAPVITNVEAAPLDDSSRVGEMLIKQLTSPVRWVETIQAMKAGGVERIIEVGPGKVLTSLIRRIDRDIETHNISGPEDIEELLSTLSLNSKEGI